MTAGIEDLLTANVARGARVSITARAPIDAMQQARTRQKHIVVRPMNKLFRLVAQYGPHCHICGLCCDFQSTNDFRAANPASRIKATRDHVIPRSQSGGHVNNTRIAHMYCNNKRGEREITDDLRKLCRAWIHTHVGEQRLAEAEAWYTDHISPLLVSLRITTTD